MSPFILFMGDNMFEDILMHGVHLIVGMLIATLWQKFKKSQEEQDAIKLGLQSLLRSEITKAYYKYVEQGWIPLYALESLQSVHDNYQALGKNGVMDELWKKLLSLPHTKPITKKEVK